MGKGIDVQLRFDHTKRMTAAIKTNLALVVKKTVFDIEAGIKNDLAQPGTGRIYAATGPTSKSGKRKRKHQASAPGQPPATDTGTLANSTVGKMLGETEGEVRVSAEYARFLEEGTVFMEPRPFFAPNVEKVRPGFNDACKQIAKL